MSFPPFDLFGLNKLVMKCEDLSNILTKEVPEGYELIGAPLTTTDYESLADCLSLAYGIQHDIWDVTRIPKVFVEIPDVKRTFRLLYKNKDGSITVAATATLKLIPNEYPGYGLVHWVAVHPNHQGKGLAKIVVSAVLQEARDKQNLNKCVLNVVDTSLPAIRTYEQFGFIPAHMEENSIPRWEAIRIAQGRIEQCSDEALGFIKLFAR